MRPVRRPSSYPADLVVLIGRPSRQAVTRAFGQARREGRSLVARTVDSPHKPGSGAAPSTATTEPRAPGGEGTRGPAGEAASKLVQAVVAEMVEG